MPGKRDSADSWIRGREDRPCCNKWILEGKAEVRPAHYAIVEQSTTDIDISAGYLDCAQTLVELYGGILRENPDDHTPEPASAQVADEGLDQKPANTTALAFAQEINGVELGVVTGECLADRASRYETEDASLIFGDEEDILPCLNEQVPLASTFLCLHGRKK